MDAPFAIAAQFAQLRQNVALSAVKQSAQQGQEIVKILNQSADNIAANGTRGTRLNVSA